MSNFWMIRAGEGGYLVSEFTEKGCVAVGFDRVGDFSTFGTLEALKTALRHTYQNLSAMQNALAAGVAHKFRTLMTDDGDRCLVASET